MRETLSDKVYRAIKDDINNFRLNPDEFIVEREMAERYGVSKAPVREALHRLCREGRLISYPRKGYLIVSLNEMEFYQTQQLRLINEGFAVRILVREAGPEDIKILRAMADKSDCVSNTEFHCKMAELTGNKFLRDIVANLLDISTRTLNLKNRLNGSNLKTYHLEIVDAIEARDEEKALKFLEMDLKLGNSSFGK
ncbi:transcriptional regulator [Thermoclostridium stercorarium subsp. stercorarium DSM 8532]|jgi:DNA-binding GntR family transcriptional regulator|uniref:Transcriptional regulator n=2 Tax=Thermoclostridium stercorarium TaxID=1510 RepID=L7VNH3_THES1|nr:GntR family transcriptional regulator [Thermoclostridium stercorarium]AGC67083.1 transcriptional regulator [Thermoclostridium stercorarium subsp. stercorarium DSM 8532]AGI38166.1 transcriptional regulator [Thermoclostridium stercorarium subsp. stercorarium DSM 8532]ANW97572.1 transcriptional regulator [Thermoclostridium stercorarium subsp. thermolacticum DSM 2910]